MNKSYYALAEIMAPVGSFESLEAALNAGCNSVYFGVEQLNMRARSTVNFTVEDLREIADRCSKRGVKAYHFKHHTLRSRCELDERHRRCRQIKRYFCNHRFRSRCSIILPSN